MPRLPVWLLPVLFPVALFVALGTWLRRQHQPVVRDCLLCRKREVCVSPNDPVCEACWPVWADEHKAFD